jgi:hypothetical protein
MVSRFEVNNNDSYNHNRVLFSCLREITITLLQPAPNAAGGSGIKVSEYDLVYFLVTASAAPVVAAVQFICGKLISLFAVESCRGGDRYRHTHSRMRTSSLHTG